MKKVGIVIATHNSERYLQECLDSVKSQTYSNIEIFVVDDCSDYDDVENPDKTIQILEKNNINFVSLGKNSGSCAKPYNIGLSYMAKKCDYVYKVDSDDILAPTAVEEMVRELELSNADWVCSDYKIFEINENGEYITKGVTRLREGAEGMHFKDGNQLSAFAMWTADCWNTNRGFREDIAYEDWEFWVELLKNGYTYSVVHASIYNYRNHDNQESKKQGHRHEYSLNVIREAIPS